MMPNANRKTLNPPPDSEPESKAEAESEAETEAETHNSQAKSFLDSG